MIPEHLAPYTSQADEEFFGAIGRLTISWGHLELGLDGMVEILYHACEGNRFEAEVPRSLQRKITFLRKILKTFPIGEALPRYLKLLDRIQAAAQYRHDIIHGIVVEHAERRGEATVVRITRGNTGIKHRRVRVTTLGVLKAAREAQKLSGHTLTWTTEMHKLLSEYVRTAKPTQRIGFLDGKLDVPDDFNTMMADEIEEMFYGDPKKYDQNNNGEG
jgi:hypothetical protein